MIKIFFILCASGFILSCDKTDINQYAAFLIRDQECSQYGSAPWECTSQVNKEWVSFSIHETEGNRVTIQNLHASFLSSHNLAPGQTLEDQTWQWHWTTYLENPQTLCKTWHEWVLHLKPTEIEFEQENSLHSKETTIQPDLDSQFECLTVEGHATETWIHSLECDGKNSISQKFTKIISTRFEPTSICKYQLVP